jgi:hypothetical protein
MNEIETKRKELENNSDVSGGITPRYKNKWILDGFNLGVEMARKEFIEKMVFLLSDYFQSVGNDNFIQMKGYYSYKLFCAECYGYLKSLGEKYYTKEVKELRKEVDSGKVDLSKYERIAEDYEEEKK